METNLNPERFQHLEIPDRVEIATGHGGLPFVKIQTPWSTAEIYLNGAHVTHFQKFGEPPLLFMSAKSQFAPGKPIRGGIPICYPWFGNRAGGPSHGFVRSLVWELAETSATPDGAVTLRLHLPKTSLPAEWSGLRTDLVVRVADKLMVGLSAKNESAGQTLEIENCLHSYFYVGDVSTVSLTGLRAAPFNDFAAGDTGTQKVETDPVLRIAQETNRVYADSTSTVEIRDENLRRTISVEKLNSRSTVVWNPWTTQKLPDDFDPAEHQIMVCVESGNVKQNKISLAPGETTTLGIILSSAPLK